MWPYLLRICPLVVMVYFFSPNEDHSCFACSGPDITLCATLFIYDPAKVRSRLRGWVRHVLRPVCLTRYWSLKFFFYYYSRIILGTRMGSCNPKCVRCGNRKRTVGQMIHLSAWLFCPATGSGSVTRRPGPACWYLGFWSRAACILSWKLCLAQYTEMTSL